MPPPAARARLDLTRLDERVVPSTVSATTTHRPLDFTATGSLATTVPVDGGPATTATSTVTLTGRIDYTSPTAGVSTTVAVAGSGSGTNLPKPATTTVGGTTPSVATTIAFAEVLQGQLAFDDAGGDVTVRDHLAVSSAWFTPTGQSGSRPLGPFAGAGSFDVSDFGLTVNLTGGGIDGDQTGTLTVTLADTTTAATDLAFESAAGTRAADGTVGADFTVAVSGKLMTAPGHGAAATRATAVWADDAGRTQAADLDVPIYWNTGRVVVSAAGLTPPAWATKLTVKLDAAGAVAEGNEANNEWTVALADLPVPPPPPPPPASPPPPPATPGAPPASFSVAPGEDLSFVEWRDVAGRVVRSAVAFEGFGGDVMVAVGDVNGDDVLDVALAAGDGGAPRVRVLDGATGAELVSVFAYAEDFRGGVNVALGDLDGDGRAELVVGAGVGGGPHVRVLDGATGMLRYEFMAYEEQARGGVFVAAADLDGDGAAEIVTGAGVGGGPVVAVFAGPTGVELQRVMAGAADDRGGARVRTETAPDGFLVVAAESDTTGSLKRFRQQLRDGEALLVPVADAQLYPAVLFGNVDPLSLS